MKYVVCCIRDVCADVWGAPIYQATVGAAQRAFSDSVNREDAQNLLHKHPEHFELYHLGYFDDTDGSFELFPKPKQLLLGSNCVVKVATKAV